MATIKEMAAKHNLCNNDQTTMAYRFGAIEVLEEIENFAVSTWCASSINTISLKKKIKELKAE